MSSYNQLSVTKGKPIEQKAIAGDNEVIILSHPEDIHSLLASMKNQHRGGAPIPGAIFSYDPLHDGTPQNRETKQGLDANLWSSRLEQIEEKLEKYNMALTEEMGVITKDLSLLRSFLNSVLEAIKSIAGELQVEIERRDMQIKRLTDLVGEQATVQKELEKAIVSMGKEAEMSWLEKLLGARGGRV